MCSLPWPPLCKLRTEMLLRLRNRFCNVETKSCHVHIFRTVINIVSITDHTHTHTLTLCVINSHSHLSLAPVSIRVGLFQPLHSAGMECAHYSPTALHVKDAGSAQRGHSALEKHKMMRSF